MSALSVSKRGPLWATLAVACALWVAPFASAQDAPAGGGAPAGGAAGGGAAGGAAGGNRGGNRGNFDPAQMRERYLTSIKERLGASDDEWKVLSPKLDKIMTAQRDARGGSNFGGRTRGGQPGAADAAPTTPVAKASADLRTAVDNKDTSAEDITKKLTALREAREKSKADVLALQKDLKDVLTPRQEAVLVTMGMLD